MKFRTKCYVHSVEDKQLRDGYVLNVVFKMRFGFGDESLTVFGRGAAWNKTRERLVHVLSKGQQVGVFGLVKASSIFTRRDGTTGLGFDFTIEDCWVTKSRLR